MTKKRKKETQKVIKPGRNIIESKAENLNKKLFKTVHQGITDLILDFANVKTVDPVGLSVIAATHNTLENTGGKLTLKNISDDMGRLFNDLGLKLNYEIKQAN